MALLDASFAGDFTGAGPFSLAGVVVANNNNRVLYISVLLGDASKDVTAVSRNGQSATRIFNGASAPDVRLQTWRILSPSVGTYPVSVATSGSMGEVGISARSVYNANQSATDSVPVTSNSILNPVSLSVTATGAADLVLDVFGVSAGAATTFTPGGGQTQNYANNGRTYRSFTGSSKPAGAAGSVEMSETWTVTTGYLNYALYMAFVVYDEGSAPPPSTINLAISNLSTASTLSTVSVGVTTPQAGVVNLAIASLSSASTLSTIAVTNTPAQATITSDVFTAYGSPAPLAALTVPHVTVTRMTDRAQVLSLANQVTNGAGRLVLTSASIVGGVWYMLASWNADGTLRGFKAHLAA